MPITAETQRLARELRLTISGIIDEDTRALVTAWERAWRGIAAEWDAAVADVLAADTALTFMQLTRQARAQNAIRAAIESLDTLVGNASVRITNAAGEVVEVTRELEARQIASQLPRSAGSQADLAVRFDRVNAEALQAIVERTTFQVTSLARPLSTEATEAMLRQLTRAIPRGLSPREAARRMLADVEGRFNGGLSRALTISRTEILDSYRSAAALQQGANADVLIGWVWSAQLDDRTCISCVSQHGTLHSLEEGGPHDHQNGRCARLPKTKSWADLGLAVNEPSDRIQTGVEWFAAQPEARQLAIAGPERLAALQSGRASMADMSTRRRTPGWRSSFVPTPASSLAA